MIEQFSVLDDIKLDGIFSNQATIRYMD